MTHTPPPPPPWWYRIDPAEYERRARALVARGWRIVRPADIDTDDPADTLTMFFDARQDPHGYGIGDLQPFAAVKWPDNWLPAPFVASPDWHRIPNAADAAGFDWLTIRLTPEVATVADRRADVDTHPGRRQEEGARDRQGEGT